MLNHTIKLVINYQDIFVDYSSYDMPLRAQVTPALIIDFKDLFSRDVV
jgi:hypothetical protein